MDKHFHITETFARLGWGPILYLPCYFYPHLIREFYANIKDKDKHSSSVLVTIVRGRKIRLTRRGLAEILGLLMFVRM